MTCMVARVPTLAKFVSDAVAPKKSAKLSRSPYYGHLAKLGLRALLLTEKSFSPVPFTPTTPTCDCESEILRSKATLLPSLVRSPAKSPWPGIVSVLLVTRAGLPPVPAMRQMLSAPFPSRREEKKNSPVLDQTGQLSWSELLVIFMRFKPLPSIENISPPVA